MRVVVYSGYGQAEDVQRTSTMAPQQVAATQPTRHESPIAVIGVTLAFFSTLMLFANIMATGAR